MTRKNLTISEEAYNALSRRKRQTESFSDVILRLAKISKERGTLSAYLKKIGPDRELANNVERASHRLRKVKLRNAQF
jgi:predicted CopG family antitoxin